jgi:hypothetical protein
MSSGTYCKFCHHYWKNRKEYDKHISCCEYFYHQRRNPPAAEMSRPTMNEMYRLVENLTNRLEKTEKEVARLRGLMNARQKKAIIEWLNQPSQTPEIAFEAWWHEIRAQESDVLKVVNGDLSQGILSCIQTHFTTTPAKILPIRCFSQKPNTFYVYSVETNKSNATAASADEASAPGPPPPISITPMWRIMSAQQFEKMCGFIVQQIIREFLVWQNKQMAFINPSTEYDERTMDRRATLLMKINGYGVSNDKRTGDVKKLLFPLIEENLRYIMDCEFE